MSVSGINSTSNNVDLLAILRQQYLAKQASSASNVSSLLDDGGDSQGSTPAPSSTAGTTPAATTTGSGGAPPNSPVRLGSEAGCRLTGRIAGLEGLLLQPDQRHQQAFRF